MKQRSKGLVFSPNLLYTRSMKIKLSLNEVKAGLEDRFGILNYYKEEGSKKEFNLAKNALKDVTCITSLTRYVEDFYPYFDSPGEDNEEISWNMIRPLLMEMAGIEEPTFELI